MTPELEEALIRVDEIIESWRHPKPRPEIPGIVDIIFWQPLALLSLGASCGVIEGVRLGVADQIKVTIGPPDGEHVAKIHEGRLVAGYFRPILARFAILTDELANPAIKSMDFSYKDNWQGIEFTRVDAKRKFEYYKNNPYGFERTFDFTDSTGTTRLTVETCNGNRMPTRGLDDFGFRITAV